MDDGDDPIVAVHMDFETSSAASLGKQKAVGAWAYFEDPTTLVMCLCWRFRHASGRYGSPLQYRIDRPEDLAALHHLAGQIARGIAVHAWSAFFEFCAWNLCLAPMFGFEPIRPEQVHDTMTQSLLFSGPADLETAGEVYDVEIRKDVVGKKAMERLAKPQGRKGLLPMDDTLNTVVEYCHTDVDAEIDIYKTLPPIPPLELKRSQDTIRINVRGVRIDQVAVAQAKQMAEAEMIRLGQQFEATYGLRAGQNGALLAWVLERDPRWNGKLNKTDIALNLEHRDVPAVVVAMLEARELINQTSLGKLDAMQRSLGLDGRIHGVLEFAGAAQTGRDAGRLVQTQNLPRDKVGLDEDDPRAMPKLMAAIRSGHIENLRKYGDPRSAISTGLRGMFVPFAGGRFVCADLASIEAVFSAALGGEKWKLAAFEEYVAGRGPDLYCKAASKMFGYEITSKKEFPRERGIGKVAELAFGFGGVVGAWRRFDPADQRTDEEIREFNRLWRAGHPGIAAKANGKGSPSGMWEGLELAAKSAILKPGKVYRFGAIKYRFENGVLGCRLPSGRAIWYHGAGLGKQEMPWVTDDGDPVYNTNIYYSRRNDGRWSRTWTYGPKLFENVVQAGCRDIMMDWCDRALAAGIPLVFRVHDELPAEVPADEAEDVAQVLRDLLPLDEPWLNNIMLADGSTIAMPLAASVDILECYQK